MKIIYLLYDFGEVKKKFEVNSNIIPNTNDMVEFENELFIVKYKKISYKNNSEKITIIIER